MTARYRTTIRFSDYIAHCLDYLSNKLDMTTNSLVNVAVDEYVKKNLFIEEQIWIMKELKVVNKNWEQLLDVDDKKWIEYFDKLNEDRKIIIEKVYQKCLKLNLKPADFVKRLPDFYKDLPKTYDGLKKLIDEGKVKPEILEKIIEGKDLPPKVTEVIPEWNELSEYEQLRIYHVLLIDTAPKDYQIDTIKAVREELKRIRDGKNGKQKSKEN